VKVVLEDLDVEELPESADFLDPFCMDLSDGGKIMTTGLLWRRRN